MAVDLNMLQLLDLQGDQIGSQFIIRFTDSAFFKALPGIPPAFDPKALSLRMDQAWDPPQRTLGTYEIYFQGLKVTKTSIVDQTDKQFQLQFRLDENWNIYQALNAWYRAAFDDIQGTAAPEKTTRTVMDVEYYGGQEAPVFTQRFQGVKILSVKPGSYDPSSGEPARVDAGFSFYYQED